MRWPITITIKVVRPTDGRGWIGLGSFALVLVVLAMIWLDKQLLKDDFFKVIATAIVLTAWINGPVGWAFQATKGGGELADSNARILRENAGLPSETPPPPPPPPGSPGAAAGEAANQVAEAASDEAGRINNGGEG